VWNQLGNDIVGSVSEQLGASVDLSCEELTDGVIVAIGANAADEYNGTTRIYQWDSTSTDWNQLGSGIGGEAVADQSGFSVSLSTRGDVVAIGATRNDGNGDDSGHTRVFKFDINADDWVQLGGNIEGETAGDWSGHSVELSNSGDAVAIGAPNNGSNSGHAIVYVLNVSKCDVGEVLSVVSI
jgi:hypothetical protein